MRSLTLALCFFALLPFAAHAGTFEDGSAAYAAGDYAGAMAIWRALAVEGHVAAQVEVARMYARGRGIAQSDMEALKWYRKAAEQGDVVAQFHAGLMYFDGKGVPPDPSSAQAWFEKAARQGHSMAQHNLAVIYATASRRDRDFVQAYAWFSVSAEHGVHMAKKKRDLAHERLREHQIAEAESLAREYAEKYGPK